MDFKQIATGILGDTLVKPLLKSLKGTFNALVGSTAGKQLARSIYKFIAAAGDPKNVPGATPQQRADLVRAAGALVLLGIDRLRAQVAEFTNAQAERELTRGTPEEAERLAAREQEERDVEAALGGLLGEAKL